MESSELAFKNRLLFTVNEILYKSAVFMKGAVVINDKITKYLKIIFLWFVCMDLV